MKTIWFILLFIVAASGAKAQTLQEVRIAIDAHENVVNTLSISIADVYSGEVSVDLTNVNAGLHTLYVDVRDADGTWSLFKAHRFVVSGKLGMEVLSAIEYFFDEDPGLGNGYLLMVPNAGTLETQFDIPIPADLTFGMHRLYVRALDGGAQWSHFDALPVQIAGNMQMLTLTKVEYSFDEMFGVGNGFWTTVSSDAIIDQDLNINVPADLALGEHKLYVRCGDGGGQWSHYASIPISICESYAPIASFSAVRYQGGAFVALSNSSEGGSSVEWTVDGEIESIADSVFVEFNEPGQYPVCVQATNSCGEDEYCDWISVNGISDFFADKGSNLGVISMTIRGGFTPNADVRLIREGFEDILATEVVFLSTGELRVLFDLRNQQIGLYQVQVQLQEGDIFVSSDFFEIVEGQPAEINLELIGKRVSRAGRPEPYHLLIENFGDEDAVAVPILLRQIPVDIATMLPGDSLGLMDISTIAFFDALFAAQVSTGFDPALITDFMKNPMDDTYGYGYIIPQVPAGASVSVDFTISSLNPGFQMNARTSYYPWLRSVATLSGETDLANPHCRAFEFKQILEEVSETTIDDAVFNACFDQAYDEALNFLANLSDNLSYTTTQLIPLPAYNGAILNQCAQCIGLTMDGDDWTYALGRFDRLSKFITADTDQCSQVSIVGMTEVDPHDVALLNEGRMFDCAPPGGGGGGGGGFSSGAFMGGLNPANRDAFENLCRIMSSDPNTKEGPIANGAWINEQRSIPYQVWFENEATASAAAQMVVITDTLDASRFDFNTFEWVAFGFDQRNYTIPKQRMDHYEVIDLRPELPNLLKYTAHFDPITGVATARFETLDTLTLALTTDPLQGFLPPNVTHPQGQGYVAFRVRSSEEVEAGDLISNEATIVFDENAAIVTAPWLLWYDDMAPQSFFTNESIISSTQFDLTWSEIDNHSGIEHVEIYLIENDLPQLYSIVDGNIESLTVEGADGAVMTFGILVYDFAGNVQNEMDLIEVSIVDQVIEHGSSELHVYPNPASDMLYIDIPHGSNMPWRIIDLAGKTLLTGKTTGLNSQIDLSLLASGVYVVEVGQWRASFARQ
jgi:hypothetical protein